MTSSYVLQRFVSAKEIKNPTFSSKGKTRCDEGGNMSGEEARTFYQTVLSSDISSIHSTGTSKVCTRQQHKTRKRESEKLSYSCSSKTGDDVNDDDDDDDDDDDIVHNIKSCPRSRAQRQHVPSSSYHRLVNQYLRNAQEGRLREVQDLLSAHSIDINACDQFSWTALMCAAHSGQIRVVKYLLEIGAAWRNHKDSQGRTALDLARLAKHLDVEELLMSYNGHIKSKDTKSFKEECSTEKTKFWCSICEQEFTDGKRVHQGSTVHLFNTQRKPQRTFYYIPEGNIGYQMMLKSGWNEDQGFLILFISFAVSWLLATVEIFQQPPKWDVHVSPLDWGIYTCRPSPGGGGNSLMQPVWEHAAVQVMVFGLSALNRAYNFRQRFVLNRVQHRVGVLGLSLS